MSFVSGPWAFNFRTAFRAPASVASGPSVPSAFGFGQLARPGIVAVRGDVKIGLA